jgi:uncharacterized membrane protein
MPSPTSATDARGSRPFRRAVLHGLALLIPPLLTVVFFLWMGNTIRLYVIGPVMSGTRAAAAWWVQRDYVVRPEGTAMEVGRYRGVRTKEGETYILLPSGGYVPEEIADYLEQAGEGGMLLTADRDAVFRRYVEHRYLQPHRVVPLVLVVFVLLLYLLGKFLAAGIGRVFWNLLEQGIFRLPLVRNVYGSIKQVTDFMLSDRQLPYTRVVAVEYPRKGIWSLGFVTGESLPELQQAAGEPTLAIMIPCSPMPLTGVTITALKSEVVELNMSIDQAFQFVISCGVVVPPPAVSRPPAAAR